MNYSYKRQTGFTLIELLVVIAVIGILASVVLASLNSGRAKARDARRLADMKQIQIALNLFYDQYGCLPLTSGSTCYSGYSESDVGGYDYSSVGGFMTFLKDSGVMSRLPLDPINNGSSGNPSNAYRYYCYTVAPFGLRLAYWKENGTLVDFIMDPTYFCK